MPIKYMFIPLFLLPVITAGQIVTNPVCGVERFPFTIDGPLCTTTNCPGECVDKGCCVNQCFDVQNYAREIQTSCKNTDRQATCSGFEEEMQCVANLYNSTVDICRQQVLLLGSNNVLIGDFNPNNCPCHNGYVRVVGDHPVIIDLCKTAGLCYSATDSYSNSTVLCLNASALPEHGTCAEDEEMDASLPVLTCESNCRGVCRDNQTDKLPVCCVPKRQSSMDNFQCIYCHCVYPYTGYWYQRVEIISRSLCSAYPQTPKSDTDDGSDVVNVGYVILIVVVVIILITIVLFVVLYNTWYRKLMNKSQQHDPGFSDLSTKNSTV